jgi:hypothetical protein
MTRADYNAAPAELIVREVSVDGRVLVTTMLDQGVARISFVHCTTAGEIAGLMDALETSLRAPDVTFPYGRAPRAVLHLMRGIRGADSFRGVRPADGRAVEVVRCGVIR